MLSMGFVLLILPFAMIWFKRYNIFFIVYLAIMEFLILAAMLFRYNEEHLRYRILDTRIVIKEGAPHARYIAIFKKIAIVHVFKCDNYFNIMVVSTTRIRNKNFKHLDFKVRDKVPEVAKLYNITHMPDDDPYYYFLVRKGGAKKYLLLDLLYRNCTDAKFTDQAIEKVIEYRKCNNK